MGEADVLLERVFVKVMVKPGMGVKGAGGLLDVQSVLIGDLPCGPMMPCLGGLDDPMSQSLIQELVPRGCDESAGSVPLLPAALVWFSLVDLQPRIVGWDGVQVSVVHG